VRSRALVYGGHGLYVGGKATLRRRRGVPKTRMDRTYIFVGRHAPEVWALTISGVVLVICTRLAWSQQPAWLNRGGTIITIVGVLLAYVDFPKWIRSKAELFWANNADLTARNALANATDKAGAMSGKELENLIAEAKSEVFSELNQTLAIDRRLVRHLEVILVIVGTFLNGFGDYIIHLLKSRV
jgi:hypothetical protein